MGTSVYRKIINKKILSSKPNFNLLSSYPRLMASRL